MKRGYRPLSTLVLLLSLLFLLVMAFNSGSGYAVAPPMLRVGISLSANHLVLTLESGDTLSSRASGSLVPLPPGSYRLENSGNGIRINDAAGNNCGVFGGPLQLVPAQGAFSIGNARYGSTYYGLLEVSTRGADALTAINIIDMETYLQGVIPREMPAAWGSYGGMEALKAQAVAARSYALYYLGAGRHKDDPYELCDGQHCQVYGGKDGRTANTDRAVAETRGRILAWNGQVIAPFYHSTNGGYTECSANVWTNPLPYLRSEPDPFDDPSNPENIRHHAALWEKDVPLEILTSLLTGSRSAVFVEKVDVIQPVFASGRVNELRISGGGQTVSFFKEQARTALGLRSQLYSVLQQPEPRVWIASAIDGITVKNSYTELEGKWAAGAHGIKCMLTGEQFTVLAADRRDTVPYMAYIFKGRGWGHGIGMSQYGAYNRARAGHTYGEILSFYYPGTQLLSAY